MLVTNGCSYVWGVELPDSIGKPSPLGFSYTLGKLLDTDVTNLSSSGACNEKIFRETVDYIWDNNPEYLVVMWSGLTRSEMFDEREPIPFIIRKKRDLGEIPEPPNEVMHYPKFDMNMHQYDKSRMDWIHFKYRSAIEWWYDDIYNSQTSITNLITKMKTLELICESRGIKLVQGSYEQDNKVKMIQCLGSKSEDWNQWLIDSLGSLKKTSLVGLPKGDTPSLGEVAEDCGREAYGHPNVQSNEVFAKHLYDLFMEMK